MNLILMNNIIETLEKLIKNDEDINLDVLRVELREDQTMIEEILGIAIDTHTPTVLAQHNTNQREITNHRNELIHELKHSLSLIPEHPSNDDGIEKMLMNAAGLLESSCYTDRSKIFKMAEQFHPS